MATPDETKVGLMKNFLGFIKNPVVSSLVATLLAAGALNLVKPLREFMLRPLEVNAIVIIIAIVVTTIGSMSITRFLLNKEHRNASSEYEAQIRSLREDIKEYRDKSNRDVLTGVYNSNQIVSVLDEIIEEANRERKTFVLILADIDGFKRINDTYNHEVGNFVLQQFAREITPRSSGDILFRYGGDEFLIISKLGTSSVSGHGFAERLRREVSEFEFLVEPNSQKREKLTLSCGVTEFIIDKDSRETLLNRVADALHLAKQPRINSDAVRQEKNFVYVIS